MTTHRQIISLVVTVAIAIVGCGKTPIAGTMDSRTKTAFGIHEWSILEDYNRGLSLDAVTDNAATAILTFDRGHTVRAVFLQNDMLSDRLIFKLDAPDDGFYGADLDGIVDPNSVSIHDRPKAKGDGWILASGTKDSASVELVLRFAENSRPKIVLVRE
ncbi:hypothetical protein [Stieleria varia]|uniref:Lipoprotein n=1 Tax=Stieleria varia TaxID=2528005 RepID=A0A5C6AP22_9BACT|nr:hypothetical protein [Stieleria varia]TWU01019.1 hypothetical protein Pla52n_43900 [Stieleria varia]